MSYNYLPHQIEAAEKMKPILQKFFIAYLAIEMRVGKTPTSILLATAYGATDVGYFTVSGKGKVKKDAIKQFTEIDPPFKWTVDTHGRARHYIQNTFDLIIIDEADKFSQFPKVTQKISTMKLVCRQVPIIFLSGTPFGDKSLSSLYHQLYLSSWSPWDRYINFYKWADYYIRGSDGVFPTKKIHADLVVRDYTQVKEKKAWNSCKHLFYFLTQAQAGFKAKKDDYHVTIPMPEELFRVIHELRKHWIFDLDENHKVVGDTAGKEWQKDHQLCSGAIIPDFKKDSETGHWEPLLDRTPHVISTYKAQWAKDNLKGKKLCIFYCYEGERHIIEQVFDNLTNSDIEFNASDDVNYYGQAESSSRGLDMSTADALVFLSIPASYRIHNQLRSRAIKYNRDRDVEIYYLFAEGGIEAEIWESFINKEDYTGKYYGQKRRQKTTNQKSLFTEQALEVKSEISTHDVKKAFSI